MLMTVKWALFYWGHGIYIMGVVDASIKVLPKYLLVMK